MTRFEITDWNWGHRQNETFRSIFKTTSLPNSTSAWARSKSCLFSLACVEATKVTLHNLVFSDHFGVDNNSGSSKLEANLSSKISERNKPGKNSHMRSCVHTFTIAMQFLNNISICIKLTFIVFRANFRTNLCQSFIRLASKCHVDLAMLNQCWIGIYMYMVITLFRSITMFYGTNNIPWDILHNRSKCGEYSA